MICVIYLMIIMNLCRTLAKSAKSTVSPTDISSTKLSSEISLGNIKKVFFCGRTTKGVGRVNPPGH